ncbi:MAG TPA: hypothetical protein VEC17_03360 [Candidatus Binatia bacterium]|nr:hypothetical protein [Candidatus Binatia bacterium]
MRKLRQIYEFFLYIFHYKNLDKAKSYTNSEKFSHFCFIAGSTILVTAFAILVVASLAFFLGKFLTPLVFFAGVTFAFCYFVLTTYYYFPQKTFRYLILVILLLAVLSFSSFYISSSVYDLSYDGQTYHQEAIIQLANGWNPIYERLEGEEFGVLSRWINHYPKASWVYSAVLYQLTGNIETGKGFALLFMLSSLLLLYSLLFLKSRMNVGLALIFGLIAAASPVVIYQSLSYYIDGQLYSLLLSLLVLLIMVYFEHEGPVFISLLAAITILVNLKFTALVYTVIILFALFVFIWVSEKITTAFKYLQLSLISLVVAIVLVGFNPYITNLIQKGNPFYPLSGSDSIDLKPYNVPENFVRKPSPVIFFSSVFSESDNVRGPGEFATWKVPFTVKENEMDAFTDTNAKEGGFGPLYGGAIILSAIGLVYGSRATKEHERKIRIALYLGLILILLTVFINPISSLARYVPQAYLLTILVLGFTFLLSDRLAKLIGLSLAIVLLYNNYLIAQTYYSYNFSVSERLEKKLTELSQESNEKSIFVNFNEMPSNRIRLQDHSIRFTTGIPEDCESERLSAGIVTDVCIK